MNNKFSEEAGVLMINLHKFATDHGIKIEVTDKLPSYDPDICVPSQRKIIINSKYNTSIDVAIRLAHEIAHILFNSYEENKIYAFSLGSNKRSERKAHLEGLKLVAHFIYRETPFEYRNWVFFMEVFGLPNAFEGMVKEAIATA